MQKLLIGRNVVGRYMYDVICYSYFIARLCLRNVFDDLQNRRILVFDCPLSLTARSIHERNSHWYVEDSGRFTQSFHKGAFDSTDRNTNA